MNPQTVKKLLESPDAQEMIVYFQECLNELNQLPDLPVEFPIPLAIEVKGRQLAYDKLKKILAPFIYLQNSGIIEGTKGSEYIT